MLGPLDYHRYFRVIIILRIVISFFSPYILLQLLPGYRIFIVMPGISLYRGSTIELP